MRVQDWNFSDGIPLQITYERVAGGVGISGDYADIDITIRRGTDGKYWTGTAWQTSFVSITFGSAQQVNSTNMPGLFRYVFSGSPATFIDTWNESYLGWYVKIEDSLLPALEYVYIQLLPSVWDEDLSDHTDSGSFGDGVLLADDAITSSVFDSNAITSSAIAQNAIGSSEIATGAIEANAFAAGAINAAAIAAGAIDAATFAAGAITSTVFANDAITAAVIADDAIDAGAIADNAIGAAQIANGAIDAATFAAGAINAAAIADDAIDADTFADNAITSAAIANNAITANTFANNAITSAVLATDCIGADEVANGAFDANVFAAGAITANTFAAGAITATTFASGAIGTTVIANDAIHAGTFADNAITASVIASGAIDTTAIANDAIHAGTFANNAITANTFAAGAINAAAIANGAIDAATFAAGAINAAAIATDAIDADAIATGAFGAAEIAADAAVEIANAVWAVEDFNLSGLAADKIGSQILGLCRTKLLSGGSAAATGNATYQFVCTTANAAGKFYDASNGPSTMPAAVNRYAVLASFGTATGHTTTDEYEGNQLVVVSGVATDGTGKYFQLKDPLTGSTTITTAIGSVLYLTTTIEAATADSIWDEVLSGHTTTGSTGDALNRVLALRQNNMQVKYTTHNVAGVPTAGILYIYGSKAHLDADSGIVGANATGSYSFTATFDSDLKALSYKSARES